MNCLVFRLTQLRAIVGFGAESSTKLEKAANFLAVDSKINKAVNNIKLQKLRTILDCNDFITTKTDVAY